MDQFYQRRTPDEQYEEDRNVAENAAQHLTITASVKCDKHWQAAPVMACQHCHQQDEIHPDGVVFMPHSYFLCFKCLNNVERKRFIFNKELFIYCLPCVEAEIARIKGISPLLFNDLRPL